MKKLIAGNWKMNKCLDTSVTLVNAITQATQDEPVDFFDSVELLVCPTFVHLMPVHNMISRLSQDKAPKIGGQDCSYNDHGAYTGDIAATMLSDIGCEYVILGHSERRTYHSESNEDVAKKAAKAHEAGLSAIVCVGETDEERSAGAAFDVIQKQLEGSLPDSANGKNTVIAYEPVWAIGTGKTASADDVKEMHSFIHEFLSKQLELVDSLRIIYGGSVNETNARELMSLEHVSGALIGGASLKADSFVSIAKQSF